MRPRKNSNGNPGFLVLGDIPSDPYSACVVPQYAAGSGQLSPYMYDAFSACRESAGALTAGKPLNFIGCPHSSGSNLKGFASFANSA